MPKRTDISSILIMGAGPIIIGQACEFDYSGTQAVRALRREGYRVVLVNSNPATIMTDPELADATYVEPLTVPFLERIIERERPDALLPTVGGQTGLNLSLALADAGILDKWSVQLIGASRQAVRVAEDRDLFKRAMLEIGAEVPRSERARSLEDGRAQDDAVGPAVPGDAQRGEGGHPPGRRGHGRIEHPVRGRARHRPPRGHRDEPAGVAVLGPGFQGDGLPDRQDRGAPRRRLHARR